MSHNDETPAEGIGEGLEMSAQDISEPSENLQDRQSAGENLASHLARRCAKARVKRADLTVLSPQVDPYTRCTPARTRDAEWLAHWFDELFPEGRTHLRGLHYRLIGQAVLPSGEEYTNTHELWLWLQDIGSAARHLGLIDGKRLIDARNDPPTIYTPEFEAARRTVSSGGISITLPDADDLDPQPFLRGVIARQAWRLCIVGEKSSVGDIARDLAEEYDATIALPNGEISLTQAEELAAAAVADGRPLAIFYISDCDPSGHQMPISLMRKFQAFTDGPYPTFKARVHRVGLTPDQVREWGLPSTPLKPTELRAAKWKERMGVEQTEIDAAIALRPTELRAALRDALDCYFDHDLSDREWDARDQWQSDAEDMLAEQIDSEMREAMRGELQSKIDQMQKLIDEINEASQIDIFELGIVLPPSPPLITGNAEGEGLPFIAEADGAADDDHWIDNTRALIRSKDYSHE